MKQLYKPTRDLFYKLNIIKDLTGKEGTRNMKQWFRRNNMNIYDSNDFISFIDWYRLDKPRPKPIHKRRSQKDKQPKNIINIDGLGDKIINKRVGNNLVDLDDGTILYESFYTKPVTLNMGRIKHGYKPIGKIVGGTMEVNNEGNLEVDLDLNLY